MRKGAVPHIEEKSWLEELWKEFRLAFSLFLDRRVSLVYKIVIPLAWAFYFLMPADLIPDVIPVLGEIDDMALLVLAVHWFVMVSPREVVEEHLRKIRGEPSSSEEGDVIDGEWHILD